MRQYIEERIRRPVPGDCCVVPGSTPVVAFGDPEIASIATLGLNPSRKEFVADDGGFLGGKHRRFETLESLGCLSLERSPRALVEAVLEGCRGYFQKNPYWRWFNQLQMVLGHLGVSYVEGSACHLDICQWATDPTWGRLDSKLQKELARQDGTFLLQQIETERPLALLLNGRSVATLFSKIAGCSFLWRGVGLFAADKEVTLGRSAVFGVPVVAWNINLQSSFGVKNELRHELGRRVAVFLGR